MKTSNTPLLIILFGLLTFSQASLLSGQGNQINQFNYSMRWSNGLPTKDVRDIIPGSYNGMVVAMSNRIGTTPWHIGLINTGMSVNNRKWTAPFMTQQISEPAASWSRNTFLWQTSVYAHYDIRKGSGRFVPYFEGGTGPAWLITSSYVTATNVQNPNLTLELEDEVIAHDFTWTVSGGAGTMIRLGTLEHCCETGWTDVYLDLYAGGTSSLTDVRHFYADDIQQLNSPLQYANFRVGLTFRINDKKDAAHKDCCSDCCCKH